MFAADAGGGTGRQRLWKLDLVTGRLRRGPRVPAAEELLAAPYPGIGWMGFVSVMPDGTRRAFALHGTAPSDRPIPVLPDHALQSISSSSDMLVAPSASLDAFRLGPVPSRASADPPPISLRGAVLYWRGRGGPLSLGDELDDLVVDRVLGWSTDASEVLVQGSLGERAGVFRVQTGPVAWMA